jgi:hypothetical protein
VVPDLGAPEALRRTHAWFESNSGWAPPDGGTLDEWMADGLCRCPDDCLVIPTRWCPHGLASWWLVLRTLDRPDGSSELPPPLLAPHPDRLDPRRRDEYVAIMDAHHQALLRGDTGYQDPETRLFVLTARTLWARGACCDQGCRHCPFIGR